MVVAALLHFLFMVGIHHEKRVEQSAVFRDVYYVIAVAHTLGTEAEQAVFCVRHAVVSPEFTDKSGVVGISHHRGPRNRVAFKKIDQP